MAELKHREWLPEKTKQFTQEISDKTANSTATEIRQQLWSLSDENRRIHEKECFNLDPAANVMNPRAEAILASGLSTRPSLGYPRDKYETGLEAIEEIEVITAELCAEIFKADYAEIRVPSGAISNLYAFMATCQPGDAIIAPPPSIGGHVTHHEAGAAGLYGLRVHHAPVDVENYSVDIEALRRLAQDVKPKLITIGGSLNLFPHNVRGAREIADEVGAKLLFDAAHQSGIIAGGSWDNPLELGAHIMTMSTYKSLGGPAGGLIVSNDATLAHKLESIAFPGMTANFDAGKSAALALTMLDWREYGAAYAKEMIAAAQRFAYELDKEGIPIFAAQKGYTQSHQFAVLAETFGGGQAASARLRQAGFLTCGIGLPVAPVAGDLNGLRIGTSEIVRWGVTTEDIPEIARLLAKALRTDKPESLAKEVSALRQKYQELHFMNIDSRIAGN
jgi:glycine hydroxymethyltransferase